MLGAQSPPNWRHNKDKEGKYQFSENKMSTVKKKKVTKWSLQAQKGSDDARILQEWIVFLSKGHSSFTSSKND